MYIKTHRISATKEHLEKKSGGGDIGNRFQVQLEEVECGERR